MQTLGSSRSGGAAGALQAETAKTMRHSAAAGSVKATAPMPGQTSARAALSRMPCEHSTLPCALANEQVRPKSQPFDAELATQRGSAPRLTQSTGAGEPERPASPFEHAKPVCVAGLREQSRDAPLSFGRGTHKDQVATGWAAVTNWSPMRPLPRQAASFVGVLFAIVLYLVCGLSAELSQMLGVDARISRPSRQGKYPLHWIIRVGWAPLSLLVVLLPPCSAQCSHCVLHCGCTLRQDRPGFAYIAGYIAEEPPTASGTIYSSQAEAEGACSADVNCAGVSEWQKSQTVIRWYTRSGAEVLLNSTGLNGAGQGRWAYWRKQSPSPPSPPPPSPSPPPPPPPPPLPPLPPPCADTNNNASDPFGDDCGDYAGTPSWCGGYDDSDFSSNEMCCACGGGGAPAVSSPSPSPSPWQPWSPIACGPNTLRILESWECAGTTDAELQAINTGTGSNCDDAGLSVGDWCEADADDCLAGANANNCGSGGDYDILVVIGPAPPSAPPPAAALAACVSSRSFPDSTLQKSANGGFQRLSWDYGCQTAHDSTSSAADCPSTVPWGGCCGFVTHCHSSACGGGGCCQASGNIGLTACHAYWGNYPPPPSPPSPPSPPPGQPCYSDGVHDYQHLSTHANPYHIPADTTYGSEGGLLTNQGGVVGITAEACEQ